ncbi:MAG: hypothetical protein ACRES0_05060 [Pseudomonas sp.]
MGRFNTLLDAIRKEPLRAVKTDEVDETVAELRERLAKRKPRIMFLVKSHSAERLQKRLSKGVAFPASR